MSRDSSFLLGTRRLSLVDQYWINVDDEGSWGVARKSCGHLWGLNKIAAIFAENIYESIHEINFLYLDSNYT